MTAKVVPIGTPNLMDVSESLRMLADQIADGEVPKADHVIVVAMANGAIDIYGYGEVGTRAHEIGCLHMAIIKLATVGIRP